MEQEMKLPDNFNGVFPFTNWRDTDFSAKWNNVQYDFPALKTSPMIIQGATPEEVQVIRKKFAKELAIEEWYKTEKFNRMNDKSNGSHPALYTDSDLEPFIQRCLEALPISQAKAKVLTRDSEDNYRKNAKGKNVTKVLDPDESLLSQGAEVMS
jgi:hypothetical protein